MGTAARAVTPTLLVGDQHPALDYFKAGSVSAAVDAIQHGLTAMVPTFEMAEEVLRGLGLPEAMIEDRLHFARTGKVLREI